MNGHEHSIEPELRGETPRRVRDTPKTRLVRLWVWNLLPAFLCFVYFLATSDIAYWENLRQHGVVVIGHVTDKKEGEDTAYRLYYKFAVGTHQVSGYEDLSDSLYKNVVIGEPVTVTTLRGNPDVYKAGVVTTDLVSSKRRTDVAYAIVGAIFYVLIALSVERSYAYRRRLLREGTVAIGTVTRRRLGQNDQGNCWINYEFTDPHTQRKVLKELCVTRERYNRCPEGETFTILFLRGQSLASELYSDVTQVEIESMPRTPNI